MSLPVFLADDQAVVRNGLKLWSEKSLVAPASYRCGAQVENLCHQRRRARRPAPPSFSCFTGGPKAHE